jgi:hypothetical protein
VPEPKPERPQFPGYGISTEPEGMLPWSWLSERMAAAQNYWIVTARPNGRPHAMPVWGVWLDETFYFSTGRESVKARNLAQSPQLVVHLESGDEVVILEGVAEEADPSLHKRLAEALDAKYPYEPDPDDMGLVFALLPHLAYAWRERDYPKSATRFSLP